MLSLPDRWAVQRILIFNLSHAWLWISKKLESVELELALQIRQATKYHINRDKEMNHWTVKIIAWTGFTKVWWNHSIENLLSQILEEPNHSILDQAQLLPQHAIRKIIKKNSMVNSAKKRNLNHTSSIT